MTAEIAAVQLATRKDWIGLAVIALPCMLYSMDLTVLNLAVPALTRDLKPSAAQLLWIIDIYGFMVAGFLMTMGVLGDRIGRRKLLLIGAACFGAASILAAFSTTAAMLIFSRAVLGIAGATLAPSTLSLITNMFRDPRERTFAISMWIMSFSIGGLVGPLIGGVVIMQYWWGAVFLIGVPVMALLLVLGPLLLPEHRDPDPGRIDVASAALSLAAVLAFIYGLKRLAESGWAMGPVLIMFLGVGLGVAFVGRQRRRADPFVDIRLFRNSAFAAAFAINIFGFFFMFGSFVMLAQYFQLVEGLSPLEAGLWNLPSALAFTVASFMNAHLASRMRPAFLLASGLAVSSFGFAIMAIAASFHAIVFATVVFSLGFTQVIALTTGLIVGAAPPEKAGAASALSETSAELGGALGVALLGSLVAVVYRSRMINAVPDGLAAEAAAGARASLGGAVEAAGQLNGPASEMLLAAARAAFSSGFHLVAGLTALMLLALALLSLAILRTTESAH